jgi:hypothetical protein
MSEAAGTSEDRPGPRPVRIAGVIIVLVAVVLVFVGPRLIRKFEEPPVVDVSDILRGEVETDIVMVRGIVQRQGGKQGCIFLEDVGEADEIIVGDISMLPVVRVQSWAWFHTGQEVRLPVRITRDSDGNLLLVEVRGRGEQDRMVGSERGHPQPGDSSAGPPEAESPREPE